MDNNWRHARLKVNSMIEAARWSQPSGDGEDVLEVPEQGRHQVRG
jgi:hypothetical protein